MGFCWDSNGVQYGFKRDFSGSWDMTPGICCLTVSDDLMRSRLGLSGFERDIDGYHGGVISSVVINLISRRNIQRWFMEHMISICSIQVHMLNEVSWDNVYIHIHTHVCNVM